MCFYVSQVEISKLQSKTVHTLMQCCIMQHFIGASTVWTHLGVTSIMVKNVSFDYRCKVCQDETTLCMSLLSKEIPDPFPSGKA